MKSTPRNSISALAVLLFASMAAAPTDAQASTFSVQVRDNNAGGGPGASDSVPVDSGPVSFPSSLGQSDAYLGRAAAGGGILRARGLATIQGVPGLSNGINAESRASFTLDDVFITGPAGFTTVNGTMNFVISGLVSTSIPTGSSAEASFTISINLPGAGDSGSIANNAGIVSSTGLLAGFAGPTISGSLTSGMGTFSTTAPNSIGISIIAAAGAGWSGGVSGQTVQANSNFYDTVNLPTSGTVFNLPDGFTANSVSGSIVNNQWTGVVPEPSSAILLLSGALFCLRRRPLRTRERNAS